MTAPNAATSIRRWGALTEPLRINVASATIVDGAALPLAHGTGAIAREKAS